MSSAALAGAAFGSTVWIATGAVTVASGACAPAGASACGGVETEISAAGAVARVARAGAAPTARAATTRTAVSATAAMTSARALIEIHGIAGPGGRSAPTTAYHRRDAGHPHPPTPRRAPPVVACSRLGRPARPD